MKKTIIFKRILSLLLSAMLIAAMAFSAVGCKDEKDNTPVIQGEETVIGEGKTEFPFSVTDANGKTTLFRVFTDEKYVGKALINSGLIEGDEGEFGIYVKTVNGITLDFDKDGKYWAFYVNDAYANQGVELTEIKAEESYSFKAEK